MFAKTSLKISGTVGIIILLLGVTILFGTYQMSKVSSEIIMISEAYKPLQESLGKIELYHASQANSFEKIVSAHNTDQSSDAAKEEFWSSTVLIKSSIEHAKKITETGFSVAPDPTQTNFRLIHQMFSEIEQEHSEYEETAKAALSSPTPALLEQLSSKHNQIQNNIESTSKQIEQFNDQAVSAIEEHERGWLIVQVAIIVTVGGIALALKHFFSQINSDLKKEIENKTRELSEANEKLQELDKMKNEFISIASHELKSPIQPIFGFAELAQSGDIDQKEAWDGVTTLAKKLQDLANDVLDVTRIESNRLALYPEKISLNGTIKEATMMARTSLTKNIAILEDLDEDITIEADRTRLDQVLRNLLNNSIKFTNSGHIKVKTRIHKEHRHAIIAVTDTGLGIPQEILPKIFGKFATKGHERENQSGNGLGLFLCKGIVEAHGGRISAKNNDGGGATFEFWLPISAKNIIVPITN
jgi:signal transduction histidine kinase